MGAFNELHVKEKDGRELSIQFKFGVRWQYVYHLGDKIEFEEGDADGPVGKHVVIGPASAIEDERRFAITIVDGVLVSWEEVDEQEIERLRRSIRGASD